MRIEIYSSLIVVNVPWNNGKDKITYTQTILIYYLYYP